MICLYCGKEITDSCSEQEKKQQWHTYCVKAFFGTMTLPEIELTDKKLEEIVDKTVENGHTVPGVQEKMSLHLLSDGGEPRLTIVDYPAGFILKPQTERFEYLPEFEALAMRLAEAAGIKTAPFALLKSNGKLAYITRRIDRDAKTGKRYGMEDFCQLSEKMTEDKYKGSYEGCGRVIRNYAKYPQLGLIDLYLQVVFSFVIGNSDLHLKNLSLIETAPDSNEYILSRAYDLLPVKVVFPEDTEEMALAVHGKKNQLRRGDFLALAENIGIGEKVGKRIIEKVCGMEGEFKELCGQAFLPKEQQEAVAELISERILRIK